MFTDVVGYTALTHRDEVLAMTLLEEHRALVRPFFLKHNRREVKTIGDAFLVEFESALDAVRCSYDMQRALHELNSGRTDDRKVQLRIGIHLGDVVHSQSDVYGDAVNLASRIQSIAPPEGVCISVQVYDQVKNKSEFHTTSLGKMELKNVGEPLEIFRLVLPWEAQEPVVQDHDRNRIAVIPFDNISPDPLDAYFADGLTDELITALSEVRELRVIARASANRYKGTSKSAYQIGRELGVSHLLEGSVRKAGNRLRITADLVDTSTQEQIWSGKYDDDLSDVFSMQSSIAASVVDSLKVRLLSKEKARIAIRETDSMAAYVAYLKGRTSLREGTEIAAHRAQEQFELAIREDPNFAMAYSGKADSIMLLGDYLYSPIPMALDEAKKCVDKALALDPNLAEARVSLANLLMYDYKFVEADREFRTAIEVNPSYATGHHWHSVCLETLGRFDEGIEEVLRAEKLDPLSSAITLSVIYRTRAKGNDEETGRRIRKLEEIDPDSPLVDEAKMVTTFVKQDWDHCLIYLRRMMQRDPADPYLDANLAYICAVTGKREQALELVEKLKKVPEDARIRGQLLAFAYLGLGDLDATFEWINHAVTNKESFLNWLRSYPLYSRVRADPRYLDVLKRAGLN
jgi:TolB-like protein/Tfp pilus assembly protein PilF